MDFREAVDVKGQDQKEVYVLQHGAKKKYEITLKMFYHYDSEIFS